MIPDAYYGLYWRERVRAGCLQQALNMVIRHGSLDAAIDTALSLRGLGMSIGAETYFVDVHLTLLAAKCRAERESQR